MAVNVAIVGATGAVGQEFLNVLAERNFPIKTLKLLASPRSAGKTATFKGKDYVVEALTHDSFNDVQIGGVLQRNVVLNTTGGTITVGPQGLASTLIGLDLIAKNVLVNGSVNNNYTSPTAYTRIVAIINEDGLQKNLAPACRLMRSAGTFSGLPADTSVQAREVLPRWRSLSRHQPPGPE